MSRRLLAVLIGAMLGIVLGAVAGLALVLMAKDRASITVLILVGASVGGLVGWAFPRTMRALGNLLSFLP